MPHFITIFVVVRCVCCDACVKVVKKQYNLVLLNNMVVIKKVFLPKVLQDYLHVQNFLIFFKFFFVIKKCRVLQLI